MTLTLAQITEKAAQHVCERNGIERDYPFERWTDVLGFEAAWSGLSTYRMIEEIVSAAIQIERNNS